jgi:hypothetical protein
VPIPVLKEPELEPAAAAKIKVLNGSNAGREITLTRQVTTLGSPAVIVVSITREHQAHLITHVQGSSLPKINDISMSTKVQYLSDGDVIDLSGTKMLFTRVE